MSEHETIVDSATRRAAVDSFGAEVVSPLVERHEHVMSPDVLCDVIEQAHAAGLLGAQSLWESTDFGVSALRALAAVNGGVAFALHRLALAQWLVARLGLDHTGAPPALSLQGHYGFGRQALAKLLAGRGLAEADTALLRDYFDPARDRVVVGAPWASVLVAVFDGREVGWLLADRADCAVEPRPHSHGFDELLTATVRTTAATTVTDTAALAEALYLDHLGMTAIAAGLVDHSLVLARAYAGGRRQGGGVIDQYPAVAQMLGTISATARSANHYLASFAAKTPGGEALAELAGVRALFHPAVCVATNNGMQVLGGRGYMQDFGLEKLVRDANTLRVLGGTPVELNLFVAEWERGQ
ncbi:acyl-CoA dehydrogenase family protein [Skermania sp. ID1734]|uniref:acyl-CoA dehydrogenase family protein n=1 Tax=Skermania sp. ID1734 TaxID=2597516 RepID=UPI00163DE5FE|nr:acyl-CoA dehydrogenase family protein [Skermania sp. ID1734]